MVVECSQTYGGSSGEGVRFLAHNIWVGHGVVDGRGCMAKIWVFSTMYVR